jgi:CTP synthase
MQVAVIEIARNICGLKDANSAEFSKKTAYPVIDIMPDQKDVTSKGGTMRLGAYPCILKKDSRVYKAFSRVEISERHRHRFEFNNEFREVMEEKGLVFSGLSPDKKLVEVIELKEHSWFLACQFHPEFKSKPMAPHPLFKEFIKASLLQKMKKVGKESTPVKRKKIIKVAEGAL